MESVKEGLVDGKIFEVSILACMHNLLQINCVCETLMPPKRQFYESVTLVDLFDLDLGK